MMPDLLGTIIGLCLVCIAVLDPGLLDAHRLLLGVAGAALVALGLWSRRAGYMKWPGATVIVAGAALLVGVITGFAFQSTQTTFWVGFWSGNAAGVVSLWSSLYRGPKSPTLTL